MGVDVIMVTDTRIDSYRELQAVSSFSKTLQRLTGKGWDGDAHGKHHSHRVGGCIIMYSNRIKKPKVKKILPLGILSSLQGR
jgi:hypothetical protein